MGLLITVDYELRLDELAEILPEAIEAGLEDACLLVENSAKDFCPVSSGELRSSISHQISGLTGIIGTNVEYAPYVELGTGIYASQGGGRQTPWRYQSADGQWHTTVGQHPQPFLKPALESNYGNIIECFQELI